MKALTIKQPWAWAIMDGTKRVENRTWKPPFTIVGQRIAIHSSARIDKAELLAYAALGAWLEPTVSALPTGAIVGTAIVAGYSVMEGNRMVQQSKGAQGYNPYNDPWFFGPVGWLLRDVRKVAPIPCKGDLGLWDVSEEYLPLLEAA
jgi:hypothetical protein